MRIKILYIIFDNFNMEGEILGYYFFIMAVTAAACYICPIIKKCLIHECCEISSDEEEEEYVEDDYDDVTPLASPSSSSSSEGTYEMTLKPDYSSSDEPEDRWVRIKVYNSQGLSSEEER